MTKHERGLIIQTVFLHFVSFPPYQAHELFSQRDRNKKLRSQLGRDLQGCGHKCLGSCTADGQQPQKGAHHCVGAAIVFCHLLLWLREKAASVAPTLGYCWEGL